MLRPLLIAAALTAATAVSPARADLSYSYVRGSALVNETDLPIGEEDGKGLELFGSYEVLSFFHVFAGYRTFELADVAFETEALQAGAGVHYDISDRSSVYFNLAALTTDSDLTLAGLGAFSSDDDGYGYSVGYREANVSGRLEFGVAVEHIELDDSGASDTWVDMSFQFRVTPRLRVETGVQFAGDENAARVGVRYYLPNRHAGQ